MQFCPGLLTYSADGNPRGRSISLQVIVLFVFVHVAMMILAGPVNELRSMITGKFALSLEDNHE